MNFFIFFFLGIGVLIVFIFVVRIVGMLRVPVRPVLDIQGLTPNGNRSPKERSACMMRLVKSGYFRNHKLTNNARAYNDDKFLKSYKRFLQKKQNIAALKQLKGWV